MHITIAAVGKGKGGPEAALCEYYTTRTGWEITVKTVEEKRKLGAEQLRAREAALLLEVIPKAAWCIALDGSGKHYSSETFAETLQHWREQGKTEIAFAIGGADGHGKALLDRADTTLSLGKMTWPHMLARTMLAEQLYRAYTLLQGHPYHRS